MTINLKDSYSFNVYPNKSLPFPDASVFTTYKVSWIWKNKSSKSQVEIKLPKPYLQLHGVDGESELELIPLRNDQLLDGAFCSSLTVCNK